MTQSALAERAGISINTLKSVLQGKPQVDTAELDELTYLIESGSDRIGALDFQLNPTEYIPRLGHNVSLDQCRRSAPQSTDQ